MVLASQIWPNFFKATTKLPQLRLSKLSHQVPAAVAGTPELTWILEITRSQVIARRYFIVNGFDGVRALLGLLVGFYVSDDVRLPVDLNACLGVAIALGLNDVRSTYSSKAA